MQSWSVHDTPTDIPPDEDQLLYAKRLVAQRCLYGVDKNPMAIDLARLSLWLATLARDHEFTFVDHSLRHGDSLVGLTRTADRGVPLESGRASCSSREWKPSSMQERLTEVNRLRQEIRQMGDQLSEQELLVRCSTPCKANCAMSAQWAT